MMTRQIFLTDDIILPPRCDHDEAIHFLRKLRERGIVIGTDEAGRGALAGPVVASAVYLTQEQEEELCAMGLRDSKRVTPVRREKLFEAMKDMNVIYRASMVSAEDIDAENVLCASLRAMRESVSKVAKLTGKAECVVVDGTEGLFTPITEGLAEYDLAKNLDIPVLLSVAPLSENIGDIIATINCAYMSNVRFRGVIINGYPSEFTDIDNLNVKSFPRLIEKYTSAKVLGILPELSRNVKPNDLISEILTGVDLESVFDVKIAKLSV